MSGKCGIVFLMLLVICIFQLISISNCSTIAQNKNENKHENNNVVEKNSNQQTSTQQESSFKDNNEIYRVLFSPLWGGEWIKDLFESYGFHESKVKTFWNLLWSNRPMKGI